MLGVTGIAVTTLAGVMFHQHYKKPPVEELVISRSKTEVASNVVALLISILGTAMIVRKALFFTRCTDYVTIFMCILSAATFLKCVYELFMKLLDVDYYVATQHGIGLTLLQGIGLY